MDEQWLIPENNEYRKEIIDDYLHYYHLNNFNTHIFKTTHPTFNSHSKLWDYDTRIEKITKLIKGKMAAANNGSYEKP